MLIRKATPADIPEIVALLKISLGESLMPKSETYWRWKHLDNPFGPSPVLLYFEGEQLVGVRAFMRWEWVRNETVLRCVRAVDTATHPAHQGKGIFKKLTLKLVEDCTSDGDQFVFNTPNTQSKPGYLKMGWQEVAALPIRVNLHRPLSMLSNRISPTIKAQQFDSDIVRLLNHHDLPSLIGSDESDTSLHTKVTTAYLTWRYLSVPVVKYIAVGYEEGSALTGLLIGRIKDGKFGRELRVTDQFLKDEKAAKGLAKELKEFRRKLRVDYTTLSGLSKPGNVVGSFNVVLPVGPMVTVRQLSVGDMSMLQQFNQWSPGLGDLELF